MFKVAGELLIILLIKLKTMVKSEIIQKVQENSTEKAECIGNMLITRLKMWKISEIKAFCLREDLWIAVKTDFTFGNILLTQTGNFRKISS